MLHSEEWPQPDMKSSHFEIGWEKNGYRWGEVAGDKRHWRNNRQWTETSGKWHLLSSKVTLLTSPLLSSHSVSLDLSLYLYCISFSSLFPLPSISPPLLVSPPFLSLPLPLSIPSFPRPSYSLLLSTWSRLALNDSPASASQTVIPPRDYRPVPLNPIPYASQTL